MGLFIVLSAGSAFGTKDPLWMYSVPIISYYGSFRFCDTLRSANIFCQEDSASYPDTDSYDGSQYLNFDYQFTQDTMYKIQTYWPCTDTVPLPDTCPHDTVYRLVRPGYAGFKTAWDLGMTTFPLARYKYLVLAYKGPLSTHKVTIWFWYNDGKCGAPSYKDSIGTIAASSTWKLDTIQIPDYIQNRPDSGRNMAYYEMDVLINNLTATDTTSSQPGNLKIDKIRLVGRNPIDMSPLSDTVHKGKDSVSVGQAETLIVATSRASDHPADTFTYQWKKDGNDILGANDSVYTIASVKYADSGVYTVAVTVSSTKLTFTSMGATLTVNAAATPTPPATTEKKNCGCGSGTGLALIPPVLFKAMSIRKRKRKSRLS
jgi:hypothetical protein